MNEPQPETEGYRLSRQQADAVDAERRLGRPLLVRGTRRFESRVELPRLRVALDSGHVAGAAFDVFSTEPATGAVGSSSVTAGLSVPGAAPVGVGWSPALSRRTRVRSREAR